MENHYTILEKLINFDTSSFKSNLESINYIESLFKQKNNFKIYKVFNSNKDKCSLLIKPCGDIKKGILFSGHIDTVPVEGQKWSTNPFRLVNKNKKLFGRGTVDMKGFLSIVISNMINQKLGQFPFCLSITHDEETGCDGIYNLSKYVLNRKLILPDKCIVGEPTKMKIVTANKGAEGIDTIVESRKNIGHSSNYNQKINTITLSAELIVFLQSLQKKIPKKNLLKCKPNNTAIHIGMAKGGIAHNIIPKKTSFRWETRHINEDLTYVKNKFFNFQRYLKKTYGRYSSDIQIKNKIVFSVPGLKEKNQTSIINFMKQFNIYGNHHVPFGTEAGIIQKLGLSTIIFGPGSIIQAHKPNEYIRIDQFEKFNLFLQNILNY